MRSFIHTEIRSSSFLHSFPELFHKDFSSLVRISNSSYFTVYADFTPTNCYLVHNIVTSNKHCVLATSCYDPVNNLAPYV